MKRKTLDNILATTKKTARVFGVIGLGFMGYKFGGETLNFLKEASGLDPSFLYQTVVYTVTTGVGAKFGDIVGNLAGSLIDDSITAYVDIFHGPHLREDVKEVNRELSRNQL